MSSDSYTRLVYHIVFSTKGRAPDITAATQETLYAYMGGIVRSLGGSLLEIGGMPDHVHLLARLRADETVASAVGRIKANSSRWLNERRCEADAFAWQRGYGAFSVSESQITVVRRYLQR
jgi:putative transposase